MSCVRRFLAGESSAQTWFKGLRVLTQVPGLIPVVGGCEIFRGVVKPDVWGGGQGGLGRIEGKGHQKKKGKPELFVASANSRLVFLTWCG